MLVGFFVPSFCDRVRINVLGSWNAIYFSIIAVPKKSLFTIFAIKNCAKHEKTREFHLYCWDHVCEVNEWCLVDCFHCEFRVSTQMMVRDYCIAKCKNFSRFKTFKLIWTMRWDLRCLNFFLWFLKKVHYMTPT